MNYLRIFFAVLAALFAIVACFNALVDPFDVFGAPIHARFNDVKSPGNERFYKPLQLSARAPKTVFLGSSRVMIALDPDAVPALDAYNMGISAATIVEEMAFARHAMADAPVKLLLLGLDFVDFNDHVEASEASRIGQLGPYLIPRSLPQLLISEQALVRSRGTVFESRRGAENDHRRNGFVVYPLHATMEPVRTRELHVEVQRYLRLNHEITEFGRSMADLDLLLQEAGTKGVRVIAFVPPSHAVLMHTLWVDGSADLYERWLRALTAVCAKHDAPLWDFSGFHPLTTAPVAESFGTFYDGSHALPSVGNQMLLAMTAGRSEPGIGERLSAANIDAHLQALRSGHDAWLDGHGSEWSDLLQQLGASPASLQPEGLP